VSNGIVEKAVRKHIQRGQTVRLRASGKPFVVDRIESDSIVLLFGKKETPTRLRWEWLEGIVPFLRERGSVPIGGVFAVESKEATLDGYLKKFIKRATANWVAALLEDSGVVRVFRQGDGFAVKLPGAAQSKNEVADYEHDISASRKETPEVARALTEASSCAQLVPTRSGSHSEALSGRAHLDALLKRRIKFVVEKGAMARLFRRGTHRQLQAELFSCLRPSEIASLASQEEFEQWLDGLIQNERWEPYSRSDLAKDRWAYFAKLVNILIYEIVVNRELFSEEDWQRVRWWLHLPIDSTVLERLQALDPSFPVPATLRGMTRDDYQSTQETARRLAGIHGVPPIWFEDAYSG
jgi:hypothetical protein